MEEDRQLPTRFLHIILQIAILMCWTRIRMHHVTMIPHFDAFVVFAHTTTQVDKDSINGEEKDTHEFLY